jgi:hypothetical protein
VRPLVSEARPMSSGVAFVECGIDDVDERHPELARLVGRGLTFFVGEPKALIAHRDAHAHLGINAALLAPEDWVERAASIYPRRTRSRLAWQLIFADGRTRC